MRVRYLKARRGWRRGDVQELPDGMANVLIARGIVEVVISRPPATGRPRRKMARGKIA